MAVAMVVVAGMSVAVRAEEPAKKELTKAEVEKIIKDGITAFRKDIVSDDEATRVKAFDRVMPDKEFMVKLFGKEDGELLWPDIEKYLGEMRKETVEFKKELEPMGDIKEIELINARDEGEALKYAELLKIIPKEIPVYRAVITDQKGAGGSSSYLVVDGKFRWFRGIEAAPEVLADKKAGK